MTELPAGPFGAIPEPLPPATSEIPRVIPKEPAPAPIIKPPAHQPGLSFARAFLIREAFRKWGS